MQPYGVKRIEWPDVGNLHEMGARTRAGRFDGRALIRSRPKRATRRYWKRRAREEDRREISRGIHRE